MRRLALIALVLAALLPAKVFAQQIGPAPAGGGGSSVSVTAGPTGNIAISPSPGTGTFTVDTAAALTTSGLTVNGSLASSLTTSGNTGYSGYFSNIGTSNNGYALGLSGPLYTATPSGTYLQNLLGGAARLPNWNKCLSKVLAGQGNCRVLCVGDSTTEGYFSTNTSSPTAALSYCGILSTVLNNAGIKATTNAFVGDSEAGSSTGDRTNLDSRMVEGSGWSQGSAPIFLSLGGGWFTASGTTSNLAYTPTGSVDTFRIWYPTQSGLGTLSYNINGGSSTSLSQSATAAYLSTTTTTTLGANTINFNYVSGVAVFVSAVEAWNSTQSQVIIGNAGWNGSKSGDWASTTLAYSPAPACGAYAADLVIINLQINDMQASTALSTYKSNLQTIISNCQSGGHTDVILMTSNHTNPSDTTNPTSEATQLTYANTIRALAAVTTNSSLVTGVPVADEFSNLVSYNYQNSVLGAVYEPGTWYQDLHPNYIANAIMARDLAQILLP